MPSGTNAFGAQVRKYLLPLLLAVAVAAIGPVIATHIAGDISENNLVSIAEQNSSRDALHIQSLMRGLGEPAPLRLKSSLVPEAFSGTFPTIVEQLNLAKLSLFDLNGKVIWSTDHATPGTSVWESPLFRKAAATRTSSKLLRDYDVIDFDGAPGQADVVETYVPILNDPSGRVIGVMALYRDVSSDMALQVNGTKSAVLWSTAATMGLLILVLFGTVIVADLTNHRSRRTEIAAIEEANRDLQEQVRIRSQELENADRQLAEARDRLLRVEKLASIGQMAGSVAHGLRNPLGSIKNAAYYLKRRLGASELARSNPRIEQFLEIIERQVDRSHQIITDLMAFACVNGPTLSPTNLGVVIENTLSGMQLRDNLRILKQFDSHLPEVSADGEQLHRVFMNLIMNAQEAMSNGGELTITTGMVGGYAEVSFSDTGPGINSEDMKKIFDPLFTTKPKGTGLGLAICQRIVLSHGGTVDVSTRSGEGTTFTVKLPLKGPGSQGG